MLQEKLQKAEEDNQLKERDAKFEEQKRYEKEKQLEQLIEQNKDIYTLEK